MVDVIRTCIGLVSAFVSLYLSKAFSLSQSQAVTLSQSYAVSLSPSKTVSPCLRMFFAQVYLSVFIFMFLLLTPSLPGWLTSTFTNSCKTGIRDTLGMGFFLQSQGTSQ